MSEERIEYFRHFIIYDFIIYDLFILDIFLKNDCGFSDFMGENQTRKGLGSLTQTQIFESLFLYIL